MNLKSLALFFLGMLFAFGLATAQMTRPSQVLAFLNLRGNFDPSLLFVMLGAISSYAIFYRLSLRMRKPLWQPSFNIPNRKEINLRLLGGAAIFGTGWGLAGYCPGPAIVALATGSIHPIYFVSAMVFGIMLSNRLLAFLASAQQARVQQLNPPTH